LFSICKIPHLYPESNGRSKTISNAFLYIDETHALHPLLMPEIKEEDEFPETFPTGVTAIVISEKI
jgi:hypothetical protein